MSLKKAQTPQIVQTDVDLSYAALPLVMTLDVPECKGTPADGPIAANPKDKLTGLEGDQWSIALLILLYILQGIPLGLSGSMPYLLQSRHVTYAEQATFSFVNWPFSLKLLWAPIVDSVYLRWFGRRKSWLVPIQYLMGLFMLGLSYRTTEILGDVEGTSGVVDIKVLTAVFFVFVLLAATQDIAVDGWALTMLSRRNVGWASTCNTVGQTTGYFLGYIVFLALESPEFCNNYLRSKPSSHGYVTLSSFMYFWGIVFLVTTTLVMIIKRENDDSMLGEVKIVPDHGIVNTYLMLWRIVRLPAVITYMGILLTAKMGFAAADSMTGLKLIEGGVPRESLAMIGVPMVPIQIILPFLISKYTAGPKPMNVFLKAMPYRLLMGLVFACVVWWAPSTKTDSGSYPLYFYGVVVIVYGIYQVTLYCMFVSGMAFTAKISDPAIGGTYMTLLNTVSNLGTDWSKTTALWMVDHLTKKDCQGAAGHCYQPAQVQACVEANGSCHTSVDGYYIEIVTCFVVGVVWMRLRARTVRRMQELPSSAWSCH